MPVRRARYPHLDGLVRRARRRVRVNRMLAASGPAAAAAGALGLAWVLAARVAVLPRAGWAVAALLAAGAAGAILAAGARPVPPVWAAWAADVWLATRDRFSTAVELAQAGRDGDGLARLQVTAAETAAGGIGALPGRAPPPTRLLGIGLGLVVLAGALGVLPNPQEVERERRAADAAAVADAVAELRDDVARLRAGAAADERAGLAERLEALAAELDGATLDEALAALDEVRAELAGRLDDDLAAQRTALAGLEQELARAGARGDAPPAQLDALAAALDAGALDAAALAERLEALAGALDAAPGVADALGAASRALRAGDGPGAAEALRAAGGVAGEAARHVDAQAAAGAAAAAAGRAADGLRAHRLAAAQGEAQGPLESNGQVEDENSGADAGAGGGDGQGGEGPGAGEGAGGGVGGGAAAGGSGQGAGGGAPGGTIGPGGGTGADAGQGGVGGAAGGQERPHRDGRLGDETVFHPPVAGGGAELRLPGQPSGAGAERDAGAGRGAGLQGDGLVPYREVLADYADEARRTIAADGYPPRLRGVVRDYFDRLGGRP